MHGAACNPFSNNRAEEVYAKEDVFGRDTTSVFPNAAKEATTLDADRVKELIGASNFISESQVGFCPHCPHHIHSAHSNTHSTQLEELKAAGRARVEDGAVSVDKSLAEVLAENKAKKDAEHKAKWEIMKQGKNLTDAAHVALHHTFIRNNNPCFTGKNKPLDEDEVEFLDTVVQQQAAADRAARLEEQRELDAFREVNTGRVFVGHTVWCIISVTTQSSTTGIAATSGTRGGGRGASRCKQTRGAKPTSAPGGTPGGTQGTHDQASRQGAGQGVRCTTTASEQACQNRGCIGASRVGCTGRCVWQ